MAPQKERKKRTGRRKAQSFSLKKYFSADECSRQWDPMLNDN
jgi:hypothetical protein